MECFDLGKLTELIENYDLGLSSNPQLGFCLSVSRGDQDLYKHSCGPVNRFSILSIASLTKHLTAITAFRKDILSKSLDYVFNSGSTPGSESSLVSFPKEKVSVTYLSNNSSKQSQELIPSLMKMIGSR